MEADAQVSIQSQLRNRKSKDAESVYQRQDMKTLQ